MKRLMIALLFTATLGFGTLAASDSAEGRAFRRGGWGRPYVSNYHAPRGYYYGGPRYSYYPRSSYYGSRYYGPSYGSRYYSGYRGGWGGGRGGVYIGF